MSLLFEFFGILLILVVSLLLSSRDPFRLDAMWSGLRALSRRRRTAVLTVGLLSLVLNAGLGTLVRKPQPAVHDEFAYLLAGDTFASGRLTNPTHRHWDHFQTHHVLHRPSYQAKYPPAQGLVLAFGQVVFGEPIAGVWISLALASGAVCWMLQGWVPSGWAFLGGLLTAVNDGIIVEWGQTYWGGAVAMLGGALLFGALPRVKRSMRARDAVAMGMGLALLANSRPYEGVLASIPAAFSLLLWLLRPARPHWDVFLLRVALPLGLMLIPTALGMMRYNRAVTGSPFIMPYQAWLKELDISPSDVVVSAFSKPTRDNGRSLLPGAPREWKTYLARRRELRGSFKMVVTKVIDQTLFFVGVPFLIAFFASLGGVPRNRTLCFATGTSLLVICATLVNRTGGYSHYVAPVTCLIMLLNIQGLRFLTVVPTGRVSGELIAQGSVALCVLSSCIILQDYASQPEGPRSWGLDRAVLTAELLERHQKNLVIVQYGSRDNSDHEWVYNPADIDRAPLIWARDLGHARNEELRAYYPDRVVWVLLPSNAQDKRQIVPYESVFPADAMPEKASSHSSRASIEVNRESGTGDADE